MFTSKTIAFVHRQKDMKCATYENHLHSTDSTQKVGRSDTPVWVHSAQPTQTVIQSNSTELTLLDTYVPGFRTMLPSGPTITCGTNSSSPSLSSSSSSLSPGSTALESSAAVAGKGLRTEPCGEPGTLVDDFTAATFERDGDLQYNCSYRTVR